MASSLAACSHAVQFEMQRVHTLISSLPLQEVVMLRGPTAVDTPATPCNN